MEQTLLKPLPTRFAEKVEFTDSCWLWKACITRTGYGLTTRGAGKLVTAHRYSWFHFHGEIPDGLCVLHKCDVRNCVNPDHLFLGTYKDNSIDRNKKGRNRRNTGELNGRAKLTESDVDEIRRLYQPGSGKPGKPSIYSMKGLAKRFNVTATQIRTIINNKAWVKE